MGNGNLDVLWLEVLRLEGGHFELVPFGGICEVTDTRKLYSEKEDGRVTDL